MFDRLKEKWGKIDFVVHAIAFSDKNELEGRYVDTSAENFSKSMLISCYSLTAIAQRAEKLMTEGGSIGINVGGLVIVQPVEKWHALTRENERLTRELIAAGELHLADETTIRQLERALAALKGVKSDEQG